MTILPNFAVTIIICCLFLLLNVVNSLHRVLETQVFVLVLVLASKVFKVIVLVLVLVPQVLELVLVLVTKVLVNISGRYP